MAGNLPPFLGSESTVAQKAELLIKRKKIKMKEGEIKLFLIFL
jgi:hypothetical protein